MIVSITPDALTCDYHQVADIEMCDGRA